MLDYYFSFIVIILLDMIIGFYFNHTHGKIGLKSHFCILILFGLCGYFINTSLGIYIFICLLSSCENHYIVEKFLLKRVDVYISHARLRMGLSVGIVAVFIFLVGELCGNGVAAVVIVSSLFIIVGLVDYFVVQFRGQHIEITEIGVATTAFKVAKNYHYKLTGDVILAVITAVINCICIVKILNTYFMIMNIAERVIGGVAAVLLLIILWTSPLLGWLGVSEEEKTADTLLLHWLLYCKNIPKELLSKQEKEKAKETLCAFSKEKSIDSNIAQLPNVIVVMNESFADMRIWGKLRTDTQVYACLDKRKEEMISMWAISSVLGGDTVYSEAEFLTGISARFCTRIPYSSFYIKNSKSEKQGITRWLEHYNYDTVAIHSYYPDMYRRPIAYPALGFRQTIFLDDFQGYTEFGSYCSDFSHYGKSLQVLKEKRHNRPQFQFNITMQNHGGYKKVFAPDERVHFEDAPVGRYLEAENYLTLVRESDRALDDYLNQLEEYEQPVVLAFFGDHQPFLPNEFMDYLTGGDYSIKNLNGSMLHQTVPLLFWANKAYRKLEE